MVYVAKQQTISGGTIGGYDATEVGNQTIPTSMLPPVKGEPAVLSTISGKENFATKVQPKIDAANIVVKTATQTQATNAATKAANAQIPTDIVPPDVQAELDANKTDTAKLLETRLANYDAQKQMATDLYTNLILAAKTSAQAQINSLTGSWQQRRDMLQQSNKANEADWTQQFIRSGQAEYSPGMSSDLLTAKEVEGMQKVKELDDAYNAQVNSINAAVESGNFRDAAQLSSDLSRIEDEALTAIQNNAAEAASVNKQIQDKAIATSRDTAIASLMTQGLTDPTKILDVLNKNGYNVTAEDVAGTLKNLTVSGNAKDLSSDMATFQYIRDNIGLPKEIAALPPEQQYFAYLAKLKQPSGSFTLGTNQVRYDEQGNVIATGPKGKTTSSSSSSSSGAPSWEEYLAAAQKAAGVNYFPTPDQDQLKAQYETQYGSADSQPFTATELKKLEQAGLAKASRKEQLDYLYKPKDTTTDTSGLPPSLQ
jgi:hypothetical protein